MKDIYISYLGELKGMSDGADWASKHTPRYIDKIVRWSKAAEKTAKLIVFPACAEDIRQTILFCIQHNFDIAVCGGGHATSGSSSTEGGVVIDLSRHMNGVDVDVAAKTVTVGGGALWRDVDRAAFEHKLAVVGGTVNHTGVGGLTLGGGYGYLTPAHGLVIDNLLSVEYVLADGSIVTASKEKNEDLFWAARGAGSCFGVASSFVFRAHHPPNNVWGAIFKFKDDQLSDLLDFGNTYLSACEMGAMPISGEEEKTLFLIAFTKLKDTDEKPSLVAVCFYNGHELEAIFFFGTLISMKPETINKEYVMPYPVINRFLNDNLGHGKRRSMKGSAFMAPLSLANISTLRDEFTSFTEEHKDAAMSTILIEYYPYNKILEVGQTDTAFANRGAYGNMLFIMTWTDPRNDDVVRSKARVWADRMQNEFKRARRAEMVNGDNIMDAATREGVGEYMNYDGFNSDGEKVFGINYGRLKRLKQRYDPNNIFNKGPRLI